MLLLQTAISALDTFPTWQGMLMCMATVIAVCTLIARYFSQAIGRRVDAFLAAQGEVAERAAEQRGEQKARMELLAAKVDEVSGDVKTLLSHQVSRPKDPHA